MKRSKGPKKAKKSSPVPNRKHHLARLIAEACHDRKAKDIVVLDLQKLSGFTDYFVIASGGSNRQVRAICDHIEEKLAKAGHRIFGREGYNEGHWVVLDYGSVVAQLFDDQARNNYALEEFWKKAKRVRFQLK